VAIHRGDAAAARQELIKAQQPRPLLTYALPHLVVQARIELVLPQHQPDSLDVTRRR